jgi:signal transduction histidine kinase
MMQEQQKKLQHELSVSSHLASVGELASGIAHEINNPLTGVIGFAELLMKKDIPEDIKQQLGIIYNGAQRVASITNRLLTFARQRKPTREKVDVNDLLSKVVELRAYEMQTHNVGVATEFAPDPLSTQADGGQLQQVFLNIILNAEQAMIEAHKEGELAITTEKIGDNVKIGTFVEIQKGAKIGRNCVFGQNANVANDVVIGSNVKVQNNVSIYTGTVIEDDVFLGPSRATRPGSAVAVGRG